MQSELTALIITAASIGFIHTLFGPDHYLPFVALSQARSWSRLKTSAITILCGLGHVLSSVVLGLIGVALGIAVTQLETVEGMRGNLAAWALIAFGLIYFVWGLRRAGKKHIHKHTHGKDEKNVTPWVLFIVFVLGPCEPLIPILMYPAAQKSTAGMLLVALVFSIVTISTMTAIVLLLTSGIKFVPARKLERYSHALAGFVILLCGLAIQFGL
jgi:nickel/cobalt exporter